MIRAASLTDSFMPIVRGLAVIASRTSFRI
jgi:hypothetical protein